MLRFCSGWCYVNVCHSLFFWLTLVPSPLSPLLSLLLRKTVSKFQREHLPATPSPRSDQCKGVEGQKCTTETGGEGPLPSRTADGTTGIITDGGGYDKQQPRFSQVFQVLAPRSTNAGKRGSAYSF